MARKQSKPEQYLHTENEQSHSDAAVLGPLIKAKQMLALRGSEKAFALEQMVATASRALNLNASRQLDLSAAVHAREAALITQLGPGWAAPHATMDEIDELVMVVGRSKRGIDYGRPELGRVHLVFLIIYNQRHHEQYLRVLAHLANVFRDEDRDEKLERAAAADTPYRLKAALGETVRRRRLVVSRRLPLVTRALIRNLLRFAAEIDADAIILFADVFKNPSLLGSFVNRKIVLATRASDVPDALAEKARGVVKLARGDFSQDSAVQLAMLAAATRGLLGDGSRVVALCGDKGSDTFDTVRMETPDAVISKIYSRGGKEIVAPEVFERAVQLLVELAEEGREGHPVGTSMVIGDEESVRGMVQQLTINPFKGYDEQERNLMDPGLEETVKEFASLDGAFVVARNGTIISAGSYLAPPSEVRVDLPSGLGTRHRVAAAITKATKAIALVLSQSTGRVTVFKGGRQVLSVSPQRNRIETHVDDEDK
jgi:diadenylate cyclase